MCLPLCWSYQSCLGVGVGETCRLEGAQAWSLEAGPSPRSPPNHYDSWARPSPRDSGESLFVKWRVGSLGKFCSPVLVCTFSGLSPEESHLKRQGGYLSGMLTLLREPFAPAPGCDSSEAQRVPTFHSQ